MVYYELAKNNPRILIFETILVSLVLMVAFFLAQLFGSFFSPILRATAPTLGQFLLLVLSLLVIVLFVWFIYDFGPPVPARPGGKEMPLVTGAFVEALEPSSGAPA